MERADEARQRTALALLLTGRANGQDQAVDQFLSFAQQQQMDVRELWGAWQESRPLVSVLLIPAAGRTAMAFLCPLTQRNLSPVLAELLHAACLAQNRQQVHLVQALLDPTQKLEHQACLEAGFKDLATLIYMQRSVEGLGESAPLPADLSVTTWSESARPLFRAAILASYQGTLDCPGLLGLRHIDDIIAGHMASGRFTPEHWLVLHHQREPAAVMLLNEVPHREAMELVYLGLSPAWRGRGLGRALLQRGLEQSRQQGAAHMVLAVDQDNAPAVRLYQSMRFAATACKVAMIFALS